MSSFLTFTIFALGLITVVLSCAVAFKFWRYQRALVGQSKKLTIAVAWQLVGEAIIGFGTLIFAYAAHIGVLEDWNIKTQSSIRFFMFFATASTTMHLYRTLIKLPGD